MMRNPSLGEIALQADAKIRRKVARSIKQAQKHGVLEAKLSPRATADVLIALFSGISFDAETIPAYDVEAAASMAMLMLKRFLRPSQNNQSR